MEEADRATKKQSEAAKKSIHHVNQGKTQKASDITSMLFQHAVHNLGLPLGDLDAWAKRVFDASEAVTRASTTISAHRLHKFNVHPIKEYNLFQGSLRDSNLGPVKPLDTKNDEAMKAWRRADNDFYLGYVLRTPFPIEQHEKTPHPRSQERRILTALYHKYFENNRKKPEWLLRTHKPGLTDFFTVPASARTPESGPP